MRGDEERADPTTRAIEKRLIAFIERELLSPRITLRPGDDLLSGGLLDSMAALRLATFVGEEFDVEIRPADFVIENFQTVAALTKFISRAAGRET